MTVLDMARDGASRPEVENFLYYEARLLDHGRYRTWLDELVDPGILYQVFTRQLRSAKNSRTSGPDTAFVYDDDHRGLDVRVAQYETGLQWRTDPPERLKHIVSNVEVFPGAAPDQLAVFCTCVVHRNRRVYDEASFVYGREDILRRDAAGRLRLLKRQVELDQRFVRGKNLLFFL